MPASAEVGRPGLLSDTYLRVSTMDPAQAYPRIRQSYSDARWIFQRQAASAQPIVLHHLPLGGLAISTVSYGRPISIHPEGDDSVLMVAGVLRGKVSIASSQQSLDGRAGCVAVVSLRDGLVFDYDGEGCTYKLTFDRARVQSICSRLMDDRPVSRLDFNMKVAADGLCQLWGAYAQMLASAACTADGTVDVPRMALTEEMLITFLLHTQPHTFSEHLQRLPRHVAPRQVKRAVAYIEDNLDETISLEKLADIAGCSMRSLHRSFKATHEVSPMRYLRDARLKRARHCLLDAANERKTIAEVAASCGFWHMGAFAAHYREQFGEAPHETRRTHQR